MINKFTCILSIIFFSLLINTKSFSWGTDAIVSIDAPTAQHSIAAKQNGTLYAAVPSALLILEYGTLFYVSTDNGTTWNPHSVVSPSNLNPVIRTKMIVTSLDSIICVIHQNNTLFFVNVESGVTGQFTTTGVQEFDVAAGAGNYIYTFVQDAGINSIKRYGTNTGGLTWTGNTTIVTSQGYRPRLTMSGTRLILNYYGPVLGDTSSSIIRSAFYNETMPGTLQPGTFQDVVTNTAAKKKQFQTILNNGIAWLLYTEGDAQQVIKCRVSNDNGATYQPEFVVAGDAMVSAHWFSAAPIYTPGSPGLTFTWYSDSVSSSSSFDQMMFATASNTAPGNFTIPTAPLDTYNDFIVDPTITNTYPEIVNFENGSSIETGVCWVEQNTTPSLYFDRLSGTTGINDNNSDQGNFTIYPSPANDVIYISTKASGVSVLNIEIFTAQGKLIVTNSVSQNNYHLNNLQMIDVSSLASGSYFVKISSINESVVREIVVIK